MTVTGNVTDNGGLDGLGITVDGGSANYSIDADGNLLVNLTSLSGTGNVFVTITDSSGASTTYSFNYGTGGG
jgi:hypothetical protein